MTCAAWVRARARARARARRAAVPPEAIILFLERPDGTVSIAQDLQAGSGVGRTVCDHFAQDALGQLGSHVRNVTARC